MALIKRSNDLIQAKYNLTLNEQRLVLYLCSRVQRSDKDFQAYEFTFADLVELTEIDKKFIYAEIKNIAKKLLSKPIVFVKSTGGQLICNWCSSFDFDKNTDTVKIRFDPGLKPYLLDLKKYFTAYDKKYVSGFTSRYSFRFYELCKQYQKLKTRKISILELKSYLDIEDNYQKISALKAYVLNPAIKDINAMSDLNISLNYIKTRRSISHVEFNINSKLETCKNERQEILIAEISKNEKEKQKEQIRNKEKSAERQKLWNDMPEEERQKKYAGASGYAKFMSEFAKIS